jgi:hypothetical protein
MILEFKTIDITTSKGWERAIKYKSDPQWKLVTGSFMGTEMLFEKEQEQIIDGLIYSSELDKWIDTDEYYKNK